MLCSDRQLVREHWRKPPLLNHSKIGNCNAAGFLQIDLWGDKRSNRVRQNIGLPCATPIEQLDGHGPSLADEPPNKTQQAQLIQVHTC